MKKIVVLFDEKNLFISTLGGTYIGAISAAEEVTEVEDKPNSAGIVLNLVKQGVTPDEIIKLKNADLI